MGDRNIRVSLAKSNPSGGGGGGGGGAPGGNKPSAARPAPTAYAPPQFPGYPPAPYTPPAGYSPYAPPAYPGYVPMPGYPVSGYPPYGPAHHYPPAHAPAPVTSRYDRKRACMAQTHACNLVTLRVGGVSVRTNRSNDIQHASFAQACSSGQLCQQRG